MTGAEISCLNVYDATEFLKSTDSHNFCSEWMAFERRDRDGSIYLASASALMLIRPSSNFSPIILSMLKKMPISFEM